MHRRYFECWRVLFLLFFLKHPVSQRHLCDERPYVSSWVFLFSYAFVEALLWSTWDFHACSNWWFLTGVSVRECLLRSPETFKVSQQILAVLLGWSPFFLDSKVYCRFSPIEKTTIPRPLIMVGIMVTFMFQKCFRSLTYQCNCRDFWVLFSLCGVLNWQNPIDY